MNRIALVMAAIVVAVFFCSPLHLPLNNPNEGVRVFTAKALVEHGTFAIDRVVKEWGYIDDKAKKDGMLYSSKAPLVSMVGALVYVLVHPISGDLSRPALTRVCRGAMGAPTLLLLGVVAFGLRKRADAMTVSLVVVGLAFAVLASVNVLSGHAFVAVGLAAAMVLGMQEQLTSRPARRARLLSIGFILAACVGAEYPAVLAAVPLGFFALWTDRRPSALAWLILGALPIVIAVCVAQHLMFGKPWLTGYSFLENRQYADLVEGTLFGIGAPVPGVLSTVLFSPELGLFFFAPFLAMGALACATNRVPKSMALTVIVVVVLMALFISGFRGFRGGWSVGPRYISELVGVLAIPIALGFDTRVSRALLAALVAVTAVHSGIAGMFFPHLSDTFRNPVYEMMVPLVARGFTPDSVGLALGLSPSIACALALIVLALPLVIAVLKDWLAVVSATVAVIAVLLIGPSLARTDHGTAALEAQRMMDNWRPDAGNPVLSRHDVREQFAIGRWHKAWPALRVTGCAPKETAPNDSFLGRVAKMIPHDSLVVVPNDLALELSNAVHTGPVWVVASQATQLKHGAPCDLWWLHLRGDGVPPALRGFTSADRVDIDDRYVVTKMKVEPPL